MPKIFIPLTANNGAENPAEAAKRKRTPTATPTATSTRTPQPTETRVPTRTTTPVPTASPTRTATAAPTSTPTRTTTPSPVPTGSATATPRPSPTATSQSNRAPAIYIDLHRCIGCNACSLACKQENNVELGELWNRVYGSESGAYPVAGVRVLPMLCHHCGNAPCKATCDSLGHHAIVQRSDGIVYIDAARCVGCGQCVSVCRYKAVFLNTQTKKAEKCHLCMHRLDAGLAPACVITCLAITREFGDYETLRTRHPNAHSMGDRVRILYDNLGDEPEHDWATGGYPNPVECHD